MSLELLHEVKDVNGVPSVPQVDGTVISLEEAFKIARPDEFLYCLYQNDGSRCQRPKPDPNEVYEPDDEDDEDDFEDDEDDEVELEQELYAHLTPKEFWYKKKEQFCEYAFDINVEPFQHLGFGPHAEYGACEPPYADDMSILAGELEKMGIQHDKEWETYVHGCYQQVLDHI